MNQTAARWAFWLMFGGFNLAFLPMHWTGIMGMPRRVWTYDLSDGWAVLNMVSTIGSFVFAAGFAVLAANVLWPRGKAPYVKRNVWGAGTMEWAAEVPDKPWGVRSIPYIHTRYPLWDQKELVGEIDRGEWFLPDAEEGKRELIVTDIVDARPLYVQRVGGPTWLTLGSAFCLGAVFILATWHLWGITLACGAGFVGFTLYWLWTGTSQIPETPEKYAGRGLTLPTYAQGNRSPGWWATFITMTGDMTAFMGLVFSYFFYWTALDNFFPSADQIPGFGWLLLGLIGLIAGWLMTVAARRVLGQGGTKPSMALLVGSVPMKALGLGAWAMGAIQAGLDPTDNSFDAMVWMLILWMGLHLILDAVMHLYVAARIWAGICTPQYRADLMNLTLFTHFLALTAVVIFMLLALFPMLMGVV
jgi:cytochrome c oxidase subunit I+III